VLECERFVIKEQVKFLTDRNTYAVLNADTGEQLGTAEEQVGPVVRALRWFVSKHVMPTRVEVREKPDDSLVFTIRRGPYVFKSRVEVHDAQGELVGFFRSKVLTISGGFRVYDKHGKQFAEVKGRWVGFDFRVVTPDGAVELGRVSKQWGGAAKELFTSADTYGVEVGPALAEQPMAKMLVLAAALAIDMIYKEESRTADVPGTG
jgi:uncharacterized protein YxjI